MCETSNTQAIEIRKFFQKKKAGPKDRPSDLEM